MMTRHGADKGRRYQLTWAATLVVAGVATLAGATGAMAQSSEELRCYSGKMGASLYHAKSLGRCHGGLAKGGSVSTFNSCMASAAAGADFRIGLADESAADSAFTCPGDLQSLALDGPAAWQDGLVTSAIFASNTLPNPCVQKRSLALSKYAGKYATCVRRGFGSTPQELDACAAKPRAAFSSSWTKAGLLAACTTGDFATVAAGVEDAIDAQGALLHVNCGDGVAAGFESCDDGNQVSGDGCEPDCTFTLRCGNGVVQIDNNEECDDGNLANGDGCDQNCIIEECGNAVLQSGEICDHGGESATCDVDCTPVACGDGTPNTTAGEQCDTAGASATCDADCTSAVCGDGTFNAAAGEQCDTAGNSATCDSDCTPAVCGDGTFNSAHGEQCDTAGASATCDADCTNAVCGDGTFNAAAGEQCDTAGNSAACDSDCTTAVCGDATPNAAAGEQCDTAGASASCDADCTLAVCGDATLNGLAGEQCDDGGESATCDSDCTPAVCGDGTVNATLGEQCDDGNTTPNDGCNDICHLESCGDGRRQVLEECDDGNAVSADGCSASCQRETCGLVGGVAACMYCPAGSSPNAGYTACTCNAGYTLVGSTCQDIDECASNPCGANPCDNLPGTYACPIACTEAAFHTALQSCGGAGRAITFDCSNTTILIADTGNGPRQNSCNGLVVDGLDRNITFEMDPKCWGRTIPAGDCRVPLDPDGTCSCPNVNSGTLFMALNGNNMTVRNLTVRYFFDGIKTGGNDNTVENMTFERVCDDSMGNNSGVGNLYTGIWAKTACGKCMQNYGVFSATASDPKLRDHYNAIVRDSLFTDCQQPIRMTNAGRYLIEYTRMEGFYASGIFRCLGPRFSTGPGDTQVVHMTGSELDGCDNGVRFDGDVQGLVWGNTFVNNEFRGLLAQANSRVSMWDNVVRYNGGLSTSDLGLGGVGMDNTAQLDLGGGSITIDGQVVSSPGRNVLCDNLAPQGNPREVDNVTVNTIMAENNYWCTMDPQSHVRGPVDTDPFLTQQP
ncbi:MAG: DUF4215 domain-containing protein [Deltaproteobacteria bacterium]|nr:DUF4215 domain-containing protein [Deltaproteobacteria bacterium]